MENQRIRVAITQGDVNGIGYEVILKTFSDPTMLEICTPIIYGSPKIMTYHRKALDLPVNFTIVGSAAEAVDGRVNVVNCNEEEVKVELGHASAESGKAAFEALEKALVDFGKGGYDVLVTAPIDKHTIQSDSFRFNGHTDYLENRIGGGQKALMVLAKDDLRVALVTTHEPVGKVASLITKETVKERLIQFSQSLKNDFAIRSPRIAVLGLNPHAGDGGLLGSEEQEVITPAIEEARAEGVVCYGPFPSDGFWGAGSFTKFDGILAMYHDQGLVPFKLLAMDEGVNLTAGLPLVRTSPDHGTAYDIAGKNIADPQSMRNAIYLAVDILKNRAMNLV